MNVNNNKPNLISITGFLFGIPFSDLLDVGIRIGTGNRLVEGQLYVWRWIETFISRIPVGTRQSHWRILSRGTFQRYVFGSLLRGEKIGYEFGSEAVNEG